MAEKLVCRSRNIKHNAYWSKRHNNRVVHGSAVFLFHLLASFLNSSYKSAASGNTAISSASSLKQALNA